MGTLAVELHPLAHNVSFTEDALNVELLDGRTISEPAGTCQSTTGRRPVIPLRRAAANLPASLAPQEPPPGVSSDRSNHWTAAIRCAIDRAVHLQHDADASAGRLERPRAGPWAGPRGGVVTQRTANP